MKKVFTEHQSELKVSADGEVFVPKSGKKPAHYTYGSIERRTGYRVVTYKDKHYYVHRLVAETYLNDNQPLDRKVWAVHHINGDKTDNRVDNLQILTHGEHSILHHKGKQHTEETKQKIRNALKGKPFTEEHKQKIREAHSISIIGTNLKTGTTVEFESLTEAWLTLNISEGNISSCLSGRRNSAGGFRWEYATS